MPGAPRNLPSTTPGTAGSFPWPTLMMIIIALSWMWGMEIMKGHATPAVDYSVFYTWVEAGKVESVEIHGQALTGQLRAPEVINAHESRNFQTVLPAEDEGLLPLIRQRVTKIVVVSDEQPLALKILLPLLPWLLVIGVWVFLAKRTQNIITGGSQLGALVKGKIHRFEKDSAVNVTFDDVAGLQAAKRDLQEVVQFLKEPERFRRLGGKVPRGVLLLGPPGTGKTLLARAVAGESGVPFFSISGSEFIEMFVGVGAARVRELFSEAKTNAPAIVFIDEIDAVGRSRGAGIGGGHDEREQTLNQLLSEMDGFERSDLIVVLAATNRPDVLDPALLRPGRFDRRVIVDRPEVGARRAILDVHVKHKPLAKDVELDAIAKNTPGFSGADLENLVNEAALHATRRGADAIAASDFAASYDKIVLGDPREAKLSAEEKRRVAVHESGHAVVAQFSPQAEPLRRVTIIPRGLALGATQQDPGEDRHLLTEPQLESRLRALMGGYAAERLVFGNVSNGAEHDLKEATKLASNMVSHYGMSKLLGPVYYQHDVEHPFLGHKIAAEGGTSEATLRTIERETQRSLAQALDSATRVLREHQSEHERLVQRLLERETLEAAELKELMAPRGEPCGSPVPPRHLQAPAPH